MEAWLILKLTIQFIAEVRCDFWEPYLGLFSPCTDEETSLFLIITNT